MDLRSPHGGDPNHEAGLRHPFGYWLAGDKLGAVQIFGAALILSALAVSAAPVIMCRSKQIYEKGDVSR